MTCIIGYNDSRKKEMHIIGDSAGVSGLDITIRADEKVFINGPFIIGFTTSFRMGQLLQFIEFPKQRKEQSDFGFMCTTFIDTIMKHFSEKKYGKLVNDEKNGGRFIVGYNGNIYTVFEDFQVSETVENFFSVGCGAKYALGALRIMDSLKMNIGKKLNDAMDVAVHSSGGVRPPYIHKKLKY